MPEPSGVQSVKDQYFKRYSSFEHGWAGWIEIDGMCVAFVGTDDKIVWMDDLGLDPRESRDASAVPQPPMEIEAA